MTISPGALGVIIITATVLVAIAPVVLLVLWIRDKRGGRLW